jgi:hypothetical protein
MNMLGTTRLASDYHNPQDSEIAVRGQRIRASNRHDQRLQIPIVLVVLPRRMVRRALVISQA